MKNRYNELSEKTKNKIDLFINSLASGTDEKQAFDESFKKIGFWFKIVSTIETKDFSDTIKVGDSLSTRDDELEIFDSHYNALDAGQKLLNGLDGGKAYNLALGSALIQIQKITCSK